VAHLRGLGRAIAWGFGSGIGRKLAAVVVLLALSWCGMEKAHAQDYSQCNLNNVQTARCVDRESAYAAARAGAQQYTPNGETACFWKETAEPEAFGMAWRAAWYGHGATCQTTYRKRSYPANVDCITPGEVWDDATKTCVVPPDCEQGGLIGEATNARLVREGQVGCIYDPATNQTCEAMVVNVGAGGTFTGMMVGGDACSPEQYTCPSGMFKDTNGLCTDIPECPEGVAYDYDLGMCQPQNECPAGQVKNVNGQCDPAPDCPAGKIKAPDGSCVEDPDNCPPGYVKGPDGTCKPDGNGDGEPDETTDTTVTGGEMCDAPPLCVGDSGTCFQAKKLWQVDCNTRKGRGQWALDHYCQRPPVCEAVTGSWQPDRTAHCDPAEEAAMVLRWQQVCELRKAVEELKKANADGTPGQPGCTDGDCNDNGQPDWTENPGNGPSNADIGEAEDDGEGNGAIGAEREITLTGPGGALDSVGLGYSRSCPNIPAVTIYGATLELNNGPLCDWLELGGQLVLILAALASLKIISGGSSV
jgi:hypothetical protein